MSGVNICTNWPALILISNFTKVEFLLQVGCSVKLEFCWDYVKIVVKERALSDFIGLILAADKKSKWDRQTFVIKIQGSSLRLMETTKKGTIYLNVKYFNIIKIVYCVPYVAESFNIHTQGEKTWIFGFTWNVY